MDTLELRQSRADRFRGVVFYRRGVLIRGRRHVSGAGGVTVRQAPEGGEEFSRNIDPVEN